MAAEEAAWLMSAQLPNGALMMHPHGTDIIPYFSNLALTEVIKFDPSYKDAVKKYLEWYFANINRTPDSQGGLVGTIYDFKLENGNWVSTNDYDSSDAYAATFLSLVRAYYDASNDFEFIKENLDDLKLVAKAIDSTMQSDGLTWAKANYHAKYLMDNSEVWRGYNDFAYLLEIVGDESYAFYQQQADNVRAGIENVLWSAAKQEYMPYQNHATVWTKFYPDAAANMWPILFGVPEAQLRATTLYQKFLQNNSGWINCTASDDSWAAIANVAVMVGDLESAKQFDSNVMSKFLTTRDWPWSIEDAAWRIRYLPLLYP